MKFKVTQEFIDKGVIRMPDCCPVALTLQSNGFPEARVGVLAAYTDRTYKVYKIMPLHLRRWISDFDSFLPVSPIEFELDLTT